MNQPAAHVPPPADLTLSPAEKTLIRNRSAIMARHLRGDSSSDARAHTRLGAALSPLGVDPAHVGPMEGPRGLAARARAPFAAAEAAADARGERGRARFLAAAFPAIGSAISPSRRRATATRTRSRPRRRRRRRRDLPPGRRRGRRNTAGVKQSSGGAWSMGSASADGRVGRDSTRRRVGGRVRARTANRGRDVGARGVIRVRASHRGAGGDGGAVREIGGDALG